MKKKKKRQMTPRISAAPRLGRGKAIENRAHKVVKRELYQEERDVLKGEMRDVNGIV